MSKSTISTFQFFQMFLDESTARIYLDGQRSQPFLIMARGHRTARQDGNTLGSCVFTA